MSILLNLYYIKNIMWKVAFILRPNIFETLSYQIKVIAKSEAATQRCSQEKVFWKYAANLQENTHAEVWFPSHFGTAWMFSCEFATYFQNNFS